jgi:hypothetical protein
MNKNVLLRVFVFATIVFIGIYLWYKIITYAIH